MVSECGPDLQADGIIRLEFAGVRISPSPEYIVNAILPGIVLVIDGPGALTVISHCQNDGFVKMFMLRDGTVAEVHDATTNIVSILACHQIADIALERFAALQLGNLTQSALVPFIRGVLSHILGLAVQFAHGGIFIILPPDLSIESFNQLISLGRTTDEPDLSAQIIDLRVANNAQVLQRHERLFDSARTVANASMVDGCVVLDHNLRLLGFGGEILVRDENPLPSCVSLAPNNAGLIPTTPVDLKNFGMRHRSSARFCAMVPNATVFVISQDKYIRAFRRLDDGKVGVCGPLFTLPGVSGLG